MGTCSRRPGCLIVTVIALLGASVLFAAGQPIVSTANQGARPWADKSLSPAQRADLLIKEMTLDEKIAMVHGVSPIPMKAYVGFVPANQRLGIPALTLADGRAGVGNHTHDVTLLPAPIAAASSWDIGLIHQYGEVLGQEQWAKGTNVALGPSIDVVRVPEWGRTFESYGEDPYFNGQMAVAEIKGIQSQGPIADANMYLTMNQESNRFKEDSIVDERTLREIYLPPFEASIRDGHVGTVMCAYVKTNGVYSCENPELQIDLLRGELHFDGWVMSDWGATHSTVASAQNGLDQQMPDDTFYGAPLKAAVRSGQVSMSVLDEHVRHILIPMFRQGLFDKAQPGSWSANVRSADHDAFSRAVAEQGTILLKNEGSILPLTIKASISVFGAAGNKEPKVEGGGSSAVVAPYKVSPLDGIRKRIGVITQVSYADGSDPVAAAKIAKDAEVAIVFAHTDESEGGDRPDLKLPGNQDQLIAAVAEANKKTIVVLDTGGAVLMPWIDKVAGVIEAWYPGQEDGNAIAAVLYGDVNPSAKLPLTFPRSASEIPTAHEEQWPGVNGLSTYSEKLNVGYRWYDATNTQPLFPFGFGLSYTSFHLSHLVAAPKQMVTASGLAHGKVHLAVEVTNTGGREGAEVVQAYVGQPRKNGEPQHQLRAFEKVQLKAGETKVVNFVLDEHSFSIFDPSVHRWISPDGTYEILVGTSSRDLPLHTSIAIGHSGADHSAHAK
jgi:beta-glucosidase